MSGHRLESGSGPPCMVGRSHIGGQSKMSYPDAGKATRPRRGAALFLGCALVAGCGRTAATFTSDDVQPIQSPVPASLTTVDTTDPATPTPEQITTYFDALREADAWAFVDAWWWSDLTTFVERLEAAAAATPAVAPASSPARPATSPTVHATPPATPAYHPPVVTGGGTPPNAFLACVRQRESGGNYSAYNPSGAAGAYQFMPGTWANLHTGYASPLQAPPAVQDAAAARLYAQAGTAPWAGGNYRC